MSSSSEATPLLEEPDLESEVPTNTRDIWQIAKLILPTVIGIFLYAFDSTLVPASYAVIGTEFRQLEHTGWIATAYMLMLASVQPLYGKLSDIFGRRACLLFAYAFYGLGCLLCGISRNMSELVVSRAIAGIGGAGLTTLSLVSILIADLVPLRMLGTWHGFLNIIFVIGQTAGSPVGGALADGPGWRWAFLVQIPLLVLATATVIILLPEPPTDHSQSVSAKLKRVDFFGAFCLVVAISTLLLGLDRAGNVAWMDLFTAILLTISLLFSVLFWKIEGSLAKEPFAPVHLMMRKGLLACYFCDFLSTASDSALIFFLPLYIQSVEKKSAIIAGIALVPAAIAATLGTLVGGWSVQKIRGFRGPVFFGYLIQAAGSVLVLLSIQTVDVQIHAVAAAYGIASFGCGFGLTATVVAIVANTGRKSQAVGTAVSFLFRSLGGVIGILIGGTIIQNALRKLIRLKLERENEVDIDAIVDGVRASLEYIDSLPDSIQTIVRTAYREVIFFVFVFAALLAIGAIFVGFFGIVDKHLDEDVINANE
ncbi:MFS general substrate transporter [Dendrothele bispora CBS 962.96]|uniref:MFS general substrate transporter n=1 Tax=Dendrothele bispora (strain CBS 962.96) TaxID=1314807 RepID=A0A4S8MXJ3_DENBC|nr:MFS general substrate transporter [Dendrothele bispora CBS 962.96]